MTALILIDFQKGLKESPFFGQARNNPEAEANSKRLLDRFREKGLPVFHVKHNSTHENSPLKPGTAGNEIKDIVKPLAGEPLFEKTVNSGFIGTELEQTLRTQGITEVIMVGLTTDHCVSTTVRMAANLGFDTKVVSDATATFSKQGINGENYDAETIHLTALASLKDEFAEVLDTATVLDRLG